MKRPTLPSRGLPRTACVAIVAAAGFAARSNGSDPLSAWRDALDGIAASRDRRHLLESIVHPDAKVEEAFRTTVLVTGDGRTVAGIVASENGDAVRLKTADGKIVTVPTASIEERSSGPSAMPADLAAKLTRREMRDLVEWLAGLTRKP